MLIEFSIIVTILVNIIAWFFFHMTISFAFYKAPYRWFEKDRNLFKLKKWEKNGKIWDEIFYLRKWKDHLPDGSAIFKRGFKKKNLRQKDPEFLKKFIAESKRAEITHYVSILPAPLFYIWNPVWAGHIMILYAVMANIPCVMAQRYNRPRMEKILFKIKKDS